METFFYGVLTFLLVLGPLVILHELGHLIVARRLGVKVLEFGFGFPPRAGGWWTGKTVIYLTPDTRFFDDETSGEEQPLPPAGAGRLEDDSPRAGAFERVVDTARRPAKGDVVTVRAVEVEPGRMEAVTVRPKSAFGADDEGEGGHIYMGKVRSIEDGRLVLADMLWSINWLPVGGFVRLLGEEDPTAEGSLASKGRGTRIAVMAAGAAVNAIIPFILFPLILMVPQDVLAGDVVITSVFPGSPGDEAGLRRGDRVVTVDGREVQSIGDLQAAVTLKLGKESNWEIMRGVSDPFPRPGAPLFLYTGDLEEISVVPRWRPPSKQVVRVVSDRETELLLGEARIYDPSAGLSNSLVVTDNVLDSLREISLRDARAIDPEVQIGDVIRVVRDGLEPDEYRAIPLTAARELNFDLGVRTRIQEGAVGIQIGTQNIREVRESEPFWTAFPNGARQAWDSVVLTRNAITGIAIGSNNPQFTESPTFTGPVGIGQLTGEIAVADVSLSVKITTLVGLAAVISFSLALINILPIPALDGGRIFFVLVEIMRGGKRISPEREGLVHLAGMIVLLALIAIISVQDIGRIFRGESFF